MLLDPQVLSIISQDSDLLNHFKELLHEEMKVEIETKQAQLASIRQAILRSLPKEDGVESDEFAKQHTPYRDQF
jgi:hypothetical protein